ncbi:MAG: S26 family signal peptidase [Phenylobacterium sp.]|uniref:S26 family signal peptidase n=1 Tax=Phenylobacterium sp. TaxID=1871053 RepID=UPI00391C69F8
MTAAVPIACAAALAVLAGLAAAATSGGAPRLLVNESRSVPRGLYLRRDDLTPERGRLVAVRQPAGPAAAYLRGLGVPSDMRLLKRVAAVPGDAVCAWAGALVTPKGAVPAPGRDRRGAPLPSWRGCRHLGAGELLVLGDTPRSFDSRFFGPLRLEQVDGVYVEVLRW